LREFHLSGARFIAAIRNFSEGGRLGDGDMAAADDYSFSLYGRHYMYLQFEMSIELTAGARASYDRFGRRFLGRSD